MTGERLLRLRDVCVIIGLGQTRVYELMAARQFPVPTRIGTNVRWSLLEIEAWISERLSERTSA